MQEYRKEYKQELLIKAAVFQAFAFFTFVQ